VHFELLLLKQLPLISQPIFVQRNVSDFHHTENDETACFRFCVCISQDKFSTLSKKLCITGLVLLYRLFKIK